MPESLKAASGLSTASFPFVGQPKTPLPPNGALIHDSVRCQCIMFLVHCLAFSISAPLTTKLVHLLSHNRRVLLSFSSSSRARSSIQRCLRHGSSPY